MSGHREMVERVKQAIMSKRPFSFGMTQLEAGKFAEAAIEAMGEPTTEMASAGWDAIMAHVGFHDVDDRAEKAYRAMIAAALSPQPLSEEVK